MQDSTENKQHIGTQSHLISLSYGQGPRGLGHGVGPKGALGPKALNPECAEVHHHHRHRHLKLKIRMLCQIPEPDSPAPRRGGTRRKPLIYEHTVSLCGGLYSTVEKYVEEIL